MAPGQTRGLTTRLLVCVVVALITHFRLLDDDKLATAREEVVVTEASDGGKGNGVLLFLRSMVDKFAQKAPKPGWRTEPQTGMSFPPKYPGTAGSRSLELVGVGARAKWGIKVYAAGMYADKKRAKVLLSRWRRVPPERLNIDPEFTDDFKKGDFDKAVIMKMTRRIPSSMLLKAIDTSVNPRLQNSERKILPRFNSIVHNALNKINIHRDTQIRMHVARKGTLSVSVDSNPPKELKHVPLCRAIIDMYVGADPVSPAAKKDICVGVSRMLATTARPTLPSMGLSKRWQRFTNKKDDTDRVQEPVKRRYPPPLTQIESSRALAYESSE
ncbi:hypothetical protein AAMO2058_000399200 [Amorphochlora amoebiformis]